MSRQETIAAAEQLLTQGKVPQALEQIRKIAGGTRDDVVVLNRLGDLLARHKQVAEAVGYYTRIAEHFVRSGFLPKAVAIHKKILRLDPGCLPAAVSLGQLYGRQKLHGEARKYLLHAANQHLKSQEFTKARELFEQLVAGEPDEVRHRVRMAEARAAEGDSQRAVEELLGVGEKLLDSGNLVDAEKIFGRASELQPDADNPLIGSARCLARTDRADEALALLEGAAEQGNSGAGLRGELARLYTMAGRSQDALQLLGETTLLEIPHDTWKSIFVAALEKGQADEMWKRVDTLFQSGNGASDAQAMAGLFEHLSDLEPDGHIPALQRLADLQERGSEVGGAVKALDALARAYRARSMESEATIVLGRLRQIAPPDEEPVAQTEAPAPPIQIEIEPTSLVQETPRREIPLEAEAPAVPLNRGDEEFVEGRVTQAEVLEKYDLLPQALEQLDEVAQRFPGHAAIHEQRIELLRTMNDPERLAEVLTQLALAQRASGDTARASQVAAEAASMPALRPASRLVLENLGLLGAPKEAGPEIPAPASAKPATAKPAPEPTPGTSGSTEVVIDLDAVGDAATDSLAETPRPAAPAAQTRVPASDLIEEIRAVAATDRPDARRRLEALLLLGYASPELDRLRQELEEAPAAPEAGQESPQEPTSAAKSVESTSAEIGIDLLEDLVDLEDLDIPLLSEPEADQDVGQILEVFKREVEQQISKDDYRTHYDLGIGYKEMGLIDEAIRELRLAASSSELHREACSLIAMCHLDRRDLAQAAEWYRQALEKGTADDEAVRGLRYDLAEVLLQGGDAEEALEHFRGVLEVDPAFRDVQGRVAELENRLQP